MIRSACAQTSSQSKAQRSIGNAIKYSPRGGDITVRVWSEQDASGEWAMVAVQDQGMGIPAEELAHIFDRFHRASNVRDQIAGTGIGLATSRHVVEQHGGTVEVESQEESGSTFTVRLPLGAGPVSTADDDPPGSIELRVG